MAKQSIGSLPISIPGYRLNHKLGQGGMGTVYHATQLSLDRPVAVKVLTRRLSKNPSMVARFEREAGALAKLNHPNLVAVYERGGLDGLYYFVMELIEGPSLRDMIASTPLTRDEFGRLVTQVGAALKHMHGQGIVHRDIKPSNILRDPQGNFRLSDFGLVHVLRSEDNNSVGARSAQSSGSLVGTPMYLAPEQLHARGTIGPATDVYGFAVVIYEMLTGVLPLGRFKLPNEMNASVSESLSDAVRTALARENSERFQTVDEFVQAVNRGIDESPNLRLRISKIAFEQREAGSSSGNNEYVNSRVGAERKGSQKGLFAFAAIAGVISLAVIGFLTMPASSSQGSSGSAGASGTTGAQASKIAASLVWSTNWADASAKAAKDGRVVVAIVTQDGKSDSVDVAMSDADVAAVRDKAVLLTLTPGDATGIPAFGTRPNIGAISALNGDGKISVRVGSVPPIEGWGEFVRQAHEDAKASDRWESNLATAIAAADRTGHPILMLASVGQLTNADLEAYKLQLMDTPSLQLYIDKTVLLAVQDKAAGDELLDKFGFFSFPLLAVVEVKRNKGVPEAEALGSGVTFPVKNVADFQPIIEALAQSQSR